MDIKGLQPELLTNGKYSHFFGYHDLIPWDIAENNFLLHRTTNDSVKIRTRNHFIDVCIWNLQTNTIEKIDETNSWNYQQGSRLQWLSDDEIIYNTRNNANFNISKIYNLNFKSTREIPFSIYDLHPQKKQAISISYEKLGKYWRGYGYSDSYSEFDIDEPLSKDDGIFSIDLETGKANLLISIFDVSQHKFEKSTSNLVHFLALPKYNPAGDKICFFERFHTKEGALYTRFFVMNADGSNLKMIGEGKQSHFDWYDNENIIIWNRPSSSLVNTFHKSGILSQPAFKQIIKTIRKLSPMLKSKVTNEHFRMVNINSLEEKSIAKNIITEDGHPMFSKNREWFICDTYPKSNNMQELYFFNLKENKKYLITELFSPSLFLDFDLKCDLHPRWNRTENKICVDTADSGKRQVHIYNVENIIPKFQ